MTGLAPAHSPIQLRFEPAAGRRLRELALDRPIVIDHFASRRCGVTVGDLRVRIGQPVMTATDELVQLDSVDGVPVLAERDLLPLLATGASLRRTGGLRGPRVAIDLDHPDAWLAFLESHPKSRR